LVEPEGFARLANAAADLHRCQSLPAKWSYEQLHNQWLSERYAEAGCDVWRTNRVIRKLRWSQAHSMEDLEQDVGAAVVALPLALDRPSAVVGDYSHAGRA
jgi:hypothetical protein